MGKGGGGSNPADVTGAAKETGEQARRLNEAQTIANRPNQNNAWGSTEWNNEPVWDQATGQYVNKWTQNETLNPTLQGAVDSQQNIQAGRSGLAEGMMGRVWDDMQNPMDFNQYGNAEAFDPSQYGDPIGFDATGQRQAAEDAAYQRSANRLDPRFESEQSSLMNQLRSKGLASGDQAYDSAMDSFGRNKNDAYEQARLGSTAEGRSEYDTALSGNQRENELRNQAYGEGREQNAQANALRDQQIQEDLFKRGYSLDEVNAMLAGQQIEGGPPSTGGTTETIANKALGGSPQ